MIIGYGEVTGNLAMTYLNVAADVVTRNKNHTDEEYDNLIIAHAIQIAKQMHNSDISNGVIMAIRTIGIV